MIDLKTVTYIAALSRLHIAEDEAGRFVKDLEGILHYVQQLDSLDVSGVRPTSHVLNIENVSRPDEVKPSLAQEQALSFAIDQVDGHYRVPKVIE